MSWLASVNARAVAAYLSHFDQVAAYYVPDVQRSIHYLACVGDDDDFAACPRCHPSSTTTEGA